MAIPLQYNIRNLKLRKSATVMTALGIALTVTTAIFIMALLAGLNAAFRSSGDPLNVLVLRKGATASEQELAEFCRSRLASFKRPEQMAFLDALPKNQLGKILRKDLRAE